MILRRSSNKRQKHTRGFICLVALGILLLIIAGDRFDNKSYASAGAIRWLTYEKGLEMGKSANKKMVIHFYADWCSYCEKMDKETFRDVKVTDFMNKEFIAVRVNSDRRANIAAEYGVKGLPSTWFVDEEGRRISNLPGYVSPEMFLNILRYVHSDSYKSMSFGKFLKSI